MTGALQRQVVPGPGARGSAWARRLGAYNGICIGLRSPGQLGLGFCEIVRRDWLNESKRYVGATSKATLTPPILSWMGATWGTRLDQSGDPAGLW